MLIFSSRSRTRPFSRRLPIDARRSCRHTPQADPLRSASHTANVAPAHQALVHRILHWHPFHNEVAPRQAMAERHNRAAAESVPSAPDDGSPPASAPYRTVPQAAPAAPSTPHSPSPTAGVGRAISAWIVWIVEVRVPRHQEDTRSAAATSRSSATTSAPDLRSNRTSTRPCSHRCPARASASRTS